MPTVGRPSLLAALAPLLSRVPVVVVDDRPSGPSLSVAGARVLRSGGRGPAAARNTGWRASDARWIAFLDDDVVPPSDWVERLLDDLSGLPDDVAATQGRIVVPLPAGRRPTDWERSTAGLQAARWATADMAYRRSVLEQVGGFDERFPRAYREDADLGLRVVAVGRRIVAGGRCVEHPVRPAPWTQSLRSQRGNADDVLMRAVHGRHWRVRAGVPRGRRRWHLVTTAAAGLALVPRVRLPAGLLWIGVTADFARRRITPGPRTPHEIATMAVTSAVLPLAATRWWLTGWLRLPALLRSGRTEPAAVGGKAQVAPAPQATNPVTATTQRSAPAGPSRR